MARKYGKKGGKPGLRMKGDMHEGKAPSKKKVGRKRL